MTVAAPVGFGDELAPVGSEEWAQHWRLRMQHIVSCLPMYPGSAKSMYELGSKHSAWRQLTDEHGKRFKSWDRFCAYKQPWGLQTDPRIFRKALEIVIGERAAALETVPVIAANGEIGNGRSDESSSDVVRATEPEPTKSFGNSRDYNLGLLVREADRGSEVAAEQLEGFKRGEVSAHRAAVNAGLRKDPPPSKIAIRAIRKITDPDELQRVSEAVNERYVELRK